MRYSPCVRSGYCCRVAACPFGWYSHRAKRCVYLGGPRAGYHWCMIHAWIRTQRGAEFSPAFEAGCSSTLNGIRRALLRGAETRRNDATT
jgi:hypothetical protein